MKPHLIPFGAYRRRGYETVPLGRREVLGVLLAGVAAGEQARMIDIPISDSTVVARWPRSGVPEYLFTVRSAGGQSLGNGIREYDWRLQVDSRNGLISVESFRPDGNQPGQPIGVFRQLLTDDVVREIHKLAVGAKLWERRAPMQEHPGYTETEYVLTQPGAGGGRLVVNNDNGPANAGISALRYRINDLLGGSFTHPERAARVALTHARTGSGELFTVTVTNVGKEKICFTDPRWVMPEGLLRKAVMKMTEFPVEVPGAAPWPMEWREWPLAPMQPRPAAEPLVTMAPGSIWKAMAPVAGREPGKRYLAYFSWANYAGAAMMDGGYRIRGRMDTPRLILEGLAR